MIDTHAHLSDKFGNDLKIEGLEGVILAASCLEDAQNNLKLAETNKKLWPALGIHPQDTDPENKLSTEKQLELLERLAGDKKTVAIGECGLDFSPAPPGEKDRDQKEQEILFRGQIGIAQKHNLPLIIHARKAVDEVIEILKEYKNLKGVFHCYAGGKKRIQKILDLPGEWYFGIDGNLTYEDGLVEVVQNVPKDRLILETDSPFLAPIPHRGETNYPEYVKYVYNRLAEIWEMSLTETEKIIDGNAKKLFKIDNRR